MCPFHHGRVEMRVGDGDGIDAAETFDHRHSRVVERRNAIPQYVAVVRAHEQHPLADCECWRGTDTDDAPLVFSERIGALPRKLCNEGTPARSRGIACHMRCRLGGTSFQLLRISAAHTGPAGHLRVPLHTYLSNVPD